MVSPAPVVLHTEAGGHGQGGSVLPACFLGNEGSKPNMEKNTITWA